MFRIENLIMDWMKFCNYGIKFNIVNSFVCNWLGEVIVVVFWKIIVFWFKIWELG